MVRASGPFGSTGEFIMNTEQLVRLLGLLEGDERVQQVLGPVLGNPHPIEDPCIDYAVSANAYLRITKGCFLMAMETLSLPDQPFEDNTGYVDSLWITRDNIQDGGVRLELPADLRWDLTAAEFSRVASMANRSSPAEVSPCWHAIAYRGFELVIGYNLESDLVRIEEVSISLPVDWVKFQAKFEPR